MDFLVDFAIKFGDWYTFGMLAVPLTILGYAIKTAVAKAEEGKSGTKSGAAVLMVIGTLISAGICVPPYYQARTKCERILAAVNDTSDGPSRIDPTTGTIDLRPDPDFGAYLKNDCVSLLHRLP